MKVAEEVKVADVPFYRKASMGVEDGDGGPPLLTPITERTERGTTMTTGDGSFGQTTAPGPVASPVARAADAPPEEVKLMHWRVLLFFTGFLLALTVAGGAIFTALELPKELRTAKRMRTRDFDQLRRIGRNLTVEDQSFLLETYNAAFPIDWHCGICPDAEDSGPAALDWDTDPDDAAAAEYRDELDKICTHHGALDKCQWRFAGAVFFVMTCWSTIGYGVFTPRTDGGKIMVIVVTLLGMIVAVQLFAAIGARLLYSLNSVLHKDGSVGFVVWVVTVGYVLLGAWYFHHFDLIEGNPPYGTAVYWCVVTISTLGFGDYVPKHTNFLANLSTYFLVVGGLSVLSVAVQHAQEGLPDISESQMIARARERFSGNPRATSTVTSHSSTGERRPTMPPKKKSLVNWMPGLATSDDPSGPRAGV